MIKSTLLSCLLAGSLVTMLAAESSAPLAGPEVEEVEVALGPMAEEDVVEIDEEIAHLHAELSRLIAHRLEIVKHEIEELHALGRHDDADRLEEMARRRLAELGQFLHRGEHGEHRERDEHAERLERHLLEMEREVQHLMEEGHVDRAEAIKAEMVEVMERVVREKPDLAPLVHEFVEGQIHRAHERLEHLYDEGDIEAAVQLEHRVRNYLKTIHERHADDELVELYVHSLHREMEALHEAGEHHAAENVHRELVRVMEVLEARHEDHEDDWDEDEWEEDRAEDDLHEMHRRLEHMMVAADHLEEAGLHEEAEHLRREAERRMMQLEREHHAREGVHEHMEEFMESVHEHAEHMMHEIEMLHHEVAELREIVGDLQRRIERMHEHRE